MDFLKNHYEKLILTLSLFALMGTAVFIAIRIGQLSGGSPDIRIPKDRGVKPIDKELYDMLVVRTSEPPLWTTKHRMFAAVPSVFAPDQTTGKLVLRPKDQIAEKAVTKLPVEWLKKYGLQNVAGVEEQDPDKDEFSNSLEQQFGTDPTNAESSPRPEDYLVFAGQVPKKFYLRFLGASTGPDGVRTFQVNVNDTEDTYLVKLGEQIANARRKENYWVDKFEPEFVEEFDASTNSKRQKDVSRLIIHRGDDPSPITLVYRQWAIDSLPTGGIRNELDRKVYYVTKNDTFTVRGQTYKVVDMKKDGMILSDSLNREIKIGPPKSAPPGEGNL